MTEDASAGDDGASLVGLLGANLSHSKLPDSIAQAGLKLGRAIRCQRLDLNVIGGDTMRGLERAKRIGLSAVAVTMPCKVEARQACDEETAEVKAIGAVNCITIVYTHCGGAAQTHVTGHNFDAIGSRLAIEERLCQSALPSATALLTGKSIHVLGAGGVGRAIVFTLSRLGAARVYLTDQKQRAVRSLIEDMSCSLNLTTLLEAEDASAVAGVAGIVNATPIGMAGGPESEQLPLPVGALDAPSLEWVFDAVCYPPTTPFLHAAAQRGLKVVGGDRMNFFVRREIFCAMSGLSAHELRGFE